MLLQTVLFIPESYESEWSTVEHFDASRESSFLKTLQFGIWSEYRWIYLKIFLITYSEIN